MGRKPVLTRVPERVQSGADYASDEEIESDAPADADYAPDEEIESDAPADADYALEHHAPDEEIESDAPADADYASDEVKGGDYSFFLKDEVSFDVLGHEIWKRPGDTVGADIRWAMVEAGRSEEDAVDVHRQHAQLEREGDAIFLRRIGDNTLELNGEPVEKGALVEISDGDEVTFSDVVTAVVHIEEVGVDTGTTVFDPDKDNIASPAEFEDPPLEAADSSDRSALGGGDTIPAGTGVNRSLDVLINTIPGEVLVLWAAIEGAAELYGFSLSLYVVLLVVAILATPVYVYRSIEKPKADSDGFTESDVRWWQESNVRWQTISATGAFLVWAYYLGGPFQLAGLQHASVAVALVIIYPVVIVISPYYGSLIVYQFSNIFGHSNV